MAKILNFPIPVDPNAMEFSVTLPPMTTGKVLGLKPPHGHSLVILVEEDESPFFGKAKYQRVLHFTVVQEGVERPGLRPENYVGRHPVFADFHIFKTHSTTRTPDVLPE